LKERGVNRVCDLQQLLPEYWNRQRYDDGSDSSRPGAMGLAPVVKVAISVVRKGDGEGKQFEWRDAGIDH
jgi:hypothetical protein